MRRVRTLGGPNDALMKKGRRAHRGRGVTVDGPRQLADGKRVPARRVRELRHRGPLGVQGGVDFHYTGEVRRIDGEAIQSRLAEGEIVLIPPLGYSPTGEVFNLDADVIASRELRLIPITPVIAVLAQSSDLAHGDPADRIIFATTVVHRAKLVSAGSIALWRHGLSYTKASC